MGEVINLIKHNACFLGLKIEGMNLSSFLIDKDDSDHLRIRGMIHQIDLIGKGVGI